MTQRAWLVPAEVVRGLTAEYAARHPGRWCSAYDPEGLQAALNRCSVVGGAMLFGSVAHVLSRFQCDRLTAFCNRWTPWMRQRLRDTKYLPSEAK